MITYCIGSARQKREYFKTVKAVMLDNTEVLFCASENGRNYFAYGDVPFASYTAAAYLKYRRALCGGKDVTPLLGEYHIRPTKKLSKLVPAEMRCVTFLEKTGGESAAPVVINLDGTKYTRRNAAALSLLLAHVKDAYVCVTDNRFLRCAVVPHRTLTFGKRVSSHRPSFYAARLLAKKLGAKRVAKM